MKWIVKVIVEAAPGDTIEHEIVTLDRPDLLSPAIVGLSIEEGKAILEGLQTQMVAGQVAGTMSASVLARAVEGFPYKGFTSPPSARSTGMCPCVCDTCGGVPAWAHRTAASRASSRTTIR